MDFQKIYNNIQGRIALDNFKIEREHIKKNKKRAVVLFSTIAIIFTCLVANNALKKKEEKVL